MGMLAITAFAQDTTSFILSTNPVGSVIMPVLAGPFFKINLEKPLQDQKTSIELDASYTDADFSSSFGEQLIDVGIKYNMYSQSVLHGFYKTAALQLIFAKDINKSGDSYGATTTLLAPMGYLGERWNFNSIVIGCDAGLGLAVAVQNDHQTTSNVAPWLGIDMTIGKVF